MAQSTSVPSTPQTSGPITPNSSFRSRNPSGEDPTSPFIHSESHLAREASRSTFPGLTTPSKKTIRSDPAMLTCFDPSDKELYNLWAPKR